VTPTDKTGYSDMVMENTGEVAPRRCYCGGCPHDSNVSAEALFLRCLLAAEKARRRRAVQRCVLLRARLRRMTNLATVFKGTLTMAANVLIAKFGSALTGRPADSRFIFTLFKPDREAAAVFHGMRRAVERVLPLPVALLMTRRTKEQLLEAAKTNGDGSKRLLKLPKLSTYQVITRDSLKDCMDYMQLGDNGEFTQLVLHGPVPDELKTHPWFLTKKPWQYYEVGHTTQEVEKNNEVRAT